jgi:ABC-2 type transport system permease protein
MLWHKAWRETRWRFIIALIILILNTGSLVFTFAGTKALLEQFDQTPQALGAFEAVIRQAAEDQRTFRGFMWYQSFHHNLTSLGVLFAILLGCGGLLSESSKGSALFTLSLPVSRKQLLGARAGAGLAELFALSMVPALVIPLLAPAVGQQFTLADALVHGLCLFTVAAVFFSLASFLSTLFGDVWRPLLIGLAIACAIAFLSFVIPQLRIFSVMSGESYFRTGSLPWAGLLTSAVIATALLYSAAETLERRDF